MITALLVIAVNSDPRAVFQSVWEGAFRTSNAFAGVVNFWIPLALCSMGLIVTFTAGLWNIGVEGQMGMGAVFASWAALFVTLPQPAQIALELALAMVRRGVVGGAGRRAQDAAGRPRDFRRRGAQRAGERGHDLSGRRVPGRRRAATANSRPDRSSPTRSCRRFRAEFPVSLLTLIVVFVADRRRDAGAARDALGLAAEGDGQERALGAAAGRADDAQRHQRAHGVRGAGGIRRIVPRAVHVQQPAHAGLRRDRLSGAAGGAAGGGAGAVGAVHRLRLRRDPRRKHAPEGRAATGSVAGGRAAGLDRAAGAAVQGGCASACWNEARRKVMTPQSGFGTHLYTGPGRSGDA